MHRVVDASAVVVLSAEAEMSPALARLTTPRALALALAPTAVGSCDQEDERVHVHVARAIFEEYGEGPDQGQAPGAIAAGTAVMAS